jgi:hypothetical protein
MRRATLLRAVACYRETFALPNGRVPATFEIITLTAWAPTENDNRDDRFVAAARSRAGVPR